MADEQFDVVIVGGAIMGAAVAYFLTHDPGFRGSVAVIERDPTYARSATTLSAASIRQQFSTPENIRMSRFGVTFLREIRERFGADADVAFHEGGYLLLAGASGAAVLNANQTVQRSEGADIALMDPELLKRAFPWLSVEGLAAGALGRSGEGWFDAHMLLQLLRRAAQAQGATFMHAEAVGIDRDGARITGVALADGRRLGCGVLVNAAGPQAGTVAALAGVPLPVEPRKRCVFVVACRTALPGMPLIVDPSGFWIRPEGSVFLCGMPPAETEDVRADDDFEIAYGLFEDVLWPALAARIPAMEALKLQRAWAGHYDFNTVDHNAIIGPHPEIGNLLFINGFSGHGVQHAPAAGRAVAELIVHGRFVSLDLSILNYERLAAGRPLRELNVI
jgi:FAD-dependent oxidoreductase domain-containing protein 1